VPAAADEGVDELVVHRLRNQDRVADHLVLGLADGVRGEHDRERDSILVEEAVLVVVEAVRVVHPVRQRGAALALRMRGRRRAGRAAAGGASGGGGIHQ
jgi:hypothetical protein